MKRAILFFLPILFYRRSNISIISCKKRIRNGKDVYALHFSVGAVEQERDWLEFTFMSKILPSFGYNVLQRLIALTDESKFLNCCLPFKLRASSFELTNA